MIYDLSQPIFNNVPQWPKFRPSTMTVPHLTAIESANVERLELMTHTGTHVDAPFHFFPEAETIDALPLSHFHAPCLALDLRPQKAGAGLAAADFEPYSRQIRPGMIVLLKTGWAEKRGLTKEFLTAWPYLTGEGAEYLVSQGIHGVGIEGLSIGGWDDPEKETAAHKVLLNAKKLIIEDICVPEAMLDGRLRHFAAFPVLIQGAGGAWTRAVAWDEGRDGMTFVLTDALEQCADRNLPAPVSAAAATILEHLREGCFQRSLCLIVATTSVASGLEVGYEHYKGSYSNPVMYTPVVLSATLAGAAVLGAFNRSAARTVLRWVSMATLADGIIGFFFHVRGVARKPGGWRLPVTNIVMGPPIFAPLLFGTSAYLGLMASYLRREEDLHRIAGKFGEAVASRGSDWRTELRYGRFQKHLSAVTVLWAFFSGFEALYSHYKTNFRYKAQWTPILLTPLVMAAAAGAIKSRSVANTVLPVVSALALADGAAGFYYHARGIVRRPGGIKKPLYNTIYGPPIFAPLLFAACGFLGLLASLLQREKR